MTSRSFTSQAKSAGKSVVSNCVIGPAPDSPATSDDQVSSTVLPSGLTIPSPVTTTRFLPFPETISLTAASYIPRPPSTRSTAPVTNLASSEQRNRTAPATSSGSPSRPSGVASSIVCVAPSGSTSVSCVFT